MAEQGSENYEQTLSLDLAAADRKLIREIDDALKRIDDGTFGICEHSGKPIKLERLEELPWARYSIEAARELERLSMRG
jgi:RNA polymerase-binding transcription factor DksA